MTWLLGTRIGRWIGAALAAAGFVLAAWMGGKRAGRIKERQKAQEDDYENAADIRDRVDRNLDQRVREMDGRGFRD